MSRRLLLLLPVLLVSPSVAQAAPQWLPPVPVATAGGEPPSPRVALGPGGEATAIWQNGGISWALRPAGADGFEARAAISADGVQPSVAYDASGNALAVWQDSDGDGVRWALRRVGASAFEPVQSVSDTGQSPDVAFDPQGNAIVVWADNGINWALWQGNSFPVAGTITTCSSPPDCPTDPAIAIDGDGTATVVWVESGIKWATRPADGDFQVQGPLGSGLAPDIAVGAESQPIAVWENNGTITWTGGEGFIKGGQPASGANPHVAYDLVGNAVAVWEDEGIKWARWPDGTVEFVLGGAVSASGIAPDVALDGAGNGTAVWAVLDEVSATYSIQAARYDPVGPPVSPPAPPAPPRRSSPSDDGSSSDRSSRRSSDRSSDDDATARAARKLKLSASKRRVTRGRAVTLEGELDASERRSACEGRQKVALQRRRSSAKRYQTFDVAVTKRNGEFSAKTKPRRTYVYRARVSRTDNCELALSSETKVKVRRKRKKGSGSRRRGRRASVPTAHEPGIWGARSSGSLDHARSA